jgi:hypothetical protein
MKDEALNKKIMIQRNFQQPEPIGPVAETLLPGDGGVSAGRVLRRGEIADGFAVERNTVHWLSDAQRVVMVQAINS